MAALKTNIPAANACFSIEVIWMLKKTKQKQNK